MRGRAMRRHKLVQRYAPVVRFLNLPPISHKKTTEGQTYRWLVVNHKDSHCVQPAAYCMLLRGCGVCQLAFSLWAGRTGRQVQA